MGMNASSGGAGRRFFGEGRNSQGFLDSSEQVACGLTHIQRGTASTRKGVYNTKSQVLWDFIFERSKVRDSCRRISCWKVS